MKFRKFELNDEFGDYNQGGSSDYNQMANPYGNQDEGKDNIEQDVTLDKDPDSFSAQEKTNAANPYVQVEEPIQENNTLIENIFSSKGFDIKKIELVDDSGNTIYKPLSEIDDDVKLTMLKELDKYRSKPTETFKKDEIELISELRKHNISFDEYVDLVLKEKLEKGEVQSNKTYSIDSLSDDELYTYDITQRFKDFSEEEIKANLELEKNNPELYSKKVQALREVYKQVEDDKISQEKIIEKQQEESSLIESAKKMLSVGNIGYVELEANDLENSLSVLLDVDKSGETVFEQALKNPETKVKLAWFLTHGEDAINQLSTYFEGEMNKLHKINVELKERLNKNTTSSPKAEVVINNNQNNHSNKQTRMSSGLPLPKSLFGDSENIPNYLDPIV